MTGGRRHRFTTPRLRRAILGLLRRRLPPGTKIDSLVIRDVGAYRFKHSLEIRLTARPPGQSTRKVLLRGNVPSTDTRREVFIADRIQRALGRRGLGATFQFPRTIGVVPSLGLNVYEDLPGTSLRSLIRRHHPRALRVAEAAGAWLRSFHNQRLHVSPRKPAARYRQETEYFRDDVLRAAPEHAGRAIRLLGPLLDAVTSVRAATRHVERSTHGDLNPGNVILNRRGHVGFIDFGSSWIDDPLSDVGNFLAQTNLVVWRGWCAPTEGAALGRAFLAGYGWSRNRPRPDAQRRRDVFRAWWTIQILAYTLSTEPALGRRIADRSLTVAENLLRRSGFVPLPDLPLIDGPGLHRALLSPSIMWAFFSDRLSDFFPSARAVTAITIDHHRAVAKTSFLTRYDLRLQVGKRTVDRAVRGNRIDRGTLRIMRLIYRSRRRTFSSMRPLAYLPTQQYVFYEAVRGSTLRSVAPTSSLFAAMVPRSAQALANLHAIDAPGVRRLPWASERAFLALLAKRVTHHLPSYRQPCQALHRQLERSLRGRWRRPSVLAHNDFQASNILLTAKGVGIIDYTQSGLAHPALDVANFRMHLRVMLHGLRSPSAIERLNDRFLNAYLRAAPPATRTAVRSALLPFELRSAFDILATTLVNLGPQDPNRRRYVTLLTNLIRERAAL